MSTTIVEAYVVVTVLDEDSAPKEASPICDANSEELKVVLKQELETIFSQLDESFLHLHV